jgi:hypothetical protein
MRQLEAQLEEALQQQQQAEAAAAAAEAAAAVAAAAAAAVAAGDGSGHGLRYLPAIDTSSAAERTLQLLDKLLLVSTDRWSSGMHMQHVIGTAVAYMVCLVQTPARCLAGLVAGSV